MNISRFSLTSSTMKFVVVFMLCFCSTTGMAQQFMLQGWWWDYPQSFGISRFGENYLTWLPDFQEAGFNYIWLPPLSRAAGGITSMGYDVQDYYDLGDQNTGGATRFGTNDDVLALTAAMQQIGIQPIADMVYNQRSGGLWENNPAVGNYITSYSAAKLDSGYNPYPSDRFRCYILLGGNSGNDTGTLYLKFRSASQSTTYYNFFYDVQMWTNKTPVATDSVYDSWEYEPNNGCQCNDSDNYYVLGYNKYAHTDFDGGCGIDEFRLHLDTSMYNVAGDTLFISMTNTTATSLSGFSDHYLYDVWSGPKNASIVNQVVYQTATDFTQMPSGRGYMNWRNFKPDGNPTMLNGDWDEMLFYYDIDQYVASTQSTLSGYENWMFDSVGIQGMRMDAVKNYTYVFSAQMLDSLFFHGYSPEMVVGEFYDYSATNLTGFISNVNNNKNPADTINMRVFDFAIRNVLLQSCQSFGYDVRNIFTGSMVDGGGGNKKNAVPFVNNHDFRTVGQQLVLNPEIAYAYVILNQKIGTPCIYLGDYNGSNFMRGRIKGLMHASQQYVTGYDEIDYLSGFNTTYNQVFINNQFQSTTIIFQVHNPLTGKNAIAAINFAGDTLDVYQNVNTSFIAAGDTFTDVFGISPTATTNITPSNQIHVVLPPRSFTLYVEGTNDSLISLGDTLAPPDTTTNAIREISKPNSFIIVYPNPFTQQFVVQLSAPVSGLMGIDVYDLSGRKVYTETMMSPSAGVIAVTPPALSSGIYMLKVTANNNPQYFKLAKN